MVTYTAQFKHKILLEYTAGNRTGSFPVLAQQYNIKGGRRTLLRWYSHWDGTAASLERKSGSGRRRLLTPQQVKKYVVKPIRRCNKEHVAVDYPELKIAMEEEIHHEISVRSLRRYGKEEGDIKDEATIGKTNQECKYESHVHC